MNELSDEQLMAAILAGHRESLGVLYERYDGVVKTVIGRFAPEISAAEREEIVQDVFITVGKSAARFPKDTRAGAWIYGIAANKTRHWRRNTWLRRRLLRERESQGVGMAFKVNNCPEQTVILRQTLSIAIEALPVDQRDVFVLHATMGCSGDEIAQILKISPKTVRTRLFRARKELMNSVESIENNPLVSAIKRNDK